MLRFTIVAVVLLVLVIFYATRLGDEPATEPEPSSEATSDVSGSGGEGPVSPIVQDNRAAEDWFPDLSDRNDVPGIDMGANASRDTFGCNILELAANLGAERTFAGPEGEERAARLFETFAVSGDVELQLAGAYLTVASDGSLGPNAYGEGQMAAIERAFRTDPTHPLVLWSAAETCSVDDSSGFCADPQLQANIQSVLGNNGEYWALVAEQRHNQGDRDGALEALRRAAVAPEFDNYFTANVRMFQRAFSMVPDTNYSVQTLGSYALAAAIAESGVHMACGAEVEARPEWLDACLALAVRSESEGLTIAQRRWGARTQSRLFGYAGQPDEAEAAAGRQRALGSFRRMTNEDVVAVMLTDERVMALFLEELESSDEMSAMYFIVGEVERLKQDPDYNPCPADEATE